MDSFTPQFNKTQNLNDRSWKRNRNSVCKNRITQTK